ncbi:hypothetical protein N431DRAFT_497207 [Stipitochalara longipes BDJ]|nr:hypothetical protein N431DRAFT_497207 [Stipitochalara longipes BDJ]
MGEPLQCPPFNGTSDFYGLGIRVGVYLQLTSSHITNTLNQEAAPENYAANSIFVFAIIVALLKAATATPHEIRPIEAWIMLQICISFLLTTLGLFGVRLHFLSPKALNRLWTFPSRQVNYHYKEGPGQAEAQPQLALPGNQDDRAVVLTHNPTQNPEDQNSSGRLRRTFRWIRKLAFSYIVMNSNQSFTMDSVSFIKHPSLSWGGSGWRISNATIVVCTNIWSWFAYVDYPLEDACSPVVFFFAPFLLSSHPGLKTLFKVGSIFMVIPIGYLFVLVVVFAQLVWEYLYEGILRVSIRLAIKRGRPTSWNGLPDNIKRRLDKISPYLRSFLQMEAFPSMGVLNQMGVISAALKNEIWMNDENALPTWSDLAKAYARISSEEHAAEIAAEKSTAEWNHIQGVHTISTTSQLIPLVIGITSSVLAVQQIILSWIKHKYHDWNEIDFKITFGAFGEHSMQIIKHKNVPTSFNKPSQTENNAATDRTGISTNGVPRESIDHIGPASPQA